MEFKDLDKRFCIRVYRWRTRIDAGVYTAEIINDLDDVLISIHACPEVFGLGRYRILQGDKCSINPVLLETAVSTAERLVGAIHVNLLPENKVS